LEETTDIFNKKKSLELLDIFKINNIKINNLNLNYNLTFKNTKFNKNILVNKYNHLFSSQEEKKYFLIDIYNINKQEPYLGLWNLLEKGEDGYKDVCWELVSLSKNLTNIFINTFSSFLNWKYILENYNIPTIILQECLPLLSKEELDILSCKPYLSLEFIEKNINHLNKDLIIKYNDNIDINLFIKDRKDLGLGIENASMKFKMSHQYFWKCENEINWSKVKYFENVPVDLIDKHLEEIDINELINCFELPTSVLLEFRNEIDWNKYIMKYDINSLILSQVYNQLPPNLLLKSCCNDINIIIKYFYNIDLSRYPDWSLATVNLTDYFNYSNNLNNLNYFKYSLEHIQYLQVLNLLNSNILNINILNNINSFEGREFFLQNINNIINKSEFNNKLSLTEQDINLYKEYNLPLKDLDILNSSSSWETRLSIENKKLLFYDLERYLLEDEINLLEYFNSKVEYEYFSDVIQTIKHKEISKSDFFYLLDKIPNRNILLVLFNICKLNLDTIFAIIGELNGKEIEDKLILIKDLYLSLKNNIHIDIEVKSLLFDNIDFSKNIDLLIKLSVNYIGAFN